MIRTKSISDFQRGIRAAMRGLWSGQTTRGDFVFSMDGAIRRGYRQAWIAGMRECGVRFADVTQEELTELENMTASNFSYILNVADWIEDGRQRSDGGLLRAIYQRANLWVNRYNAVRDKAKSMACANQPMIWILGETDHCRSCSALSGQVRRNNTWDTIVRPQSQELECGGYRCQCQLVPTTQNVTRGRLPRWR